MIISGCFINSQIYVIARIEEMNCISNWTRNHAQTVFKNDFNPISIKRNCSSSSVEWGQYKKRNSSKNVLSIRSSVWQKHKIFETIFDIFPMSSKISLIAFNRSTFFIRFENKKHIEHKMIFKFIFFWWLIRFDFIHVFFDRIVQSFFSKSTIILDVIRFVFNNVIVFDLYKKNNFGDVQTFLQKEQMFSKNVELKERTSFYVNSLLLFGNIHVMPYHLF